MDYFLDQRLIEEENMLAPSLKQFSLRVEILPSYIPVRVAEKILFVGESVQMFENQNVNLTRKGRHLLASGPHPQGLHSLNALWALLHSQAEGAAGGSHGPRWQHVQGCLPPSSLACPGVPSGSDSASLLCRLHFEKPGGHICCRAASPQAAAALQPGGLRAGGGRHPQHRG